MQISDSEPMFRVAHDVSVFHLSGEVGKWEGSELLRKIDELLALEWGKIVLDLREVEHIHYRFLAELQGRTNETSELQGGIKLAHVNLYHRRLLEVAGVQDEFETYSSVADAILSFDSDDSPSAGTC